MNTPRNEIDLYLEKLLSLQFEASDWISHRPTKGMLREQFLRQLICNEFENIILKSGVVEEKQGSHRQLDLVWLKQNARTGQLSYYELNDCKMITEVKSMSQPSELALLNKSSEIYKEKCCDIKIGMFSYSTNSSRQNTIKKFGFEYDAQYETYSDYNYFLDQYYYIDFFFCLDINADEKRPYFIVRDKFKKNSLFLDSPAITYFLNMFKE